MKALVLGAGRMGRAAAWDLARQPETRAVTLADRSVSALETGVTEIRGLENGVEVAAQTIDLDSSDGLKALLEDHDVVLSSSDYRFNEQVTDAAIETRTHFCDLGGNLFVVERQLARSADAAAAGITVVPDCGLAPGMACLFAAAGVERMGGRADSVRIRVGGLPAHPKPPLNYKLVFSVRGLTNEYLEPAEMIRDGQIVREPSLTEVETLEFPEPFGTLEAFNTSGGASTLPRTLKGRVRNLDYKTIRYPGHCAAFAGMASIGLLGEERVDGVEPRAFVEKLIERSLQDDDTDVTLVRVTVEGEHEGTKKRLVFEVIDHHDDRTGHSAMARTTAYPAAAIAYLLGTGQIEKKGVLPGEEAVPLEAFIEAVRSRGIEVRERWEGPAS